MKKHPIANIVVTNYTVLVRAAGRLSRTININTGRKNYETYHCIHARTCIAS